MYNFVSITNSYQMNIKRELICISTILLLCAGVTAAQEDTGWTVEVIENNKARHFHETMPAGQYSGITYIGDNTFAVVSDDDPGYGFHLWKMELDSVNGQVMAMENLGFRGDGGEKKHDLEGIAYDPYARTLWISNENEHAVVELDMEGQPTGRRIDMPDSIKESITSNRSLEALCYDAQSRTLWVGIESTIKLDGEASTATNGKPSLCRIMAYDEQLRMTKSIRFKTQTPKGQEEAKVFAMGISAMASIGDGYLLVLEREARVPEQLLGATATARIYIINAAATPDGEIAEKRLLATIETKANLLKQDWANFEGMALTPADAHGNRVLMLVADSQGQYKGLLKDWVKTLKIREIRHTTEAHNKAAEVHDKSTEPHGKAVKEENKAVEVQETSEKKEEKQ